MVLPRFLMLSTAACMVAAFSAAPGEAAKTEDPLKRFTPVPASEPVTIAGVFDWERMIREVRWLDENSARAKRLLRKLGDPVEKKTYFDEISPLRHIDNVRIPLLSRTAPLTRWSTSRNPSALFQNWSA